MRLFAALPLPSEAMERLTRVRLRLSEPKDGLRWSPPEQWHITLQFYGECDEQRAACLIQGLAEMSFEASPVVVLEKLCQFSAKGILYVSVARTEELRSLQEQVAKMSAYCGFLPEPRPFRPHVTLARSKGPAGFKTLKRLSTPDLPSFGPAVQWQAREIHLLRSTLRPQGAEYTLIACRDLAQTGSHDPGESS